jgi:hypothetical protein
VTPTRFLLLACLAITSCTRKETSAGGFADHLRPVTSTPAGHVRRTVYVPVYSSIYWGVDTGRDVVDLAATLSVRNVSAQHAVIVHYVRYYDSGGRKLKDHVNAPAELAPLASAEFVVAQRDRSGGPGANFLVQWSGPTDVDEPLIESVMVGQKGNAGLSFTSPGRTIKNEPRD